MAISAAAVFEVRDTGSDSNGGFYVPGSGTDYSQSDTPILTIADCVTNGTTTVTSTAGLFTAAMVNNGINIAGTIRQITARASGSSITVDAAVTAGSGQTASVGGAFATLNKATSNAVAGNTIWVKAGSGYTISANLTLSAAQSLPSTASPNRISGYTTTRGDNGRVTLTASGTTTALLPLNVAGYVVENFLLDCNNVANYGVDFSSQWITVRNVHVTGFKLIGIRANAAFFIIDWCRIYSGISGATNGISCGGSGLIYRCTVNSNPCNGISTGNGFVNVDRCLIYSNSGASSDGVIAQYGPTVKNCVIYNNGRDGVRVFNFAMALFVKGNIIVSNAGYGLNFTAGPQTYNQDVWDGNAYYSNTSGARNGLGTGITDITLTASPFTNAGSGDFSLNNTAGGGAACRAAGVPGAFPGGLTTGYLDIGAAQHADPAGGGLIGGGNLNGGLQ